MASPEPVLPARASRGPGRDAGCVLLESNPILQPGRDMKLQSLMLRNSLFLLTLILALPAFRAAAQSKPDSVTAPETQSKTQQGFRPLPRNDAGLEGAQGGARGACSARGAAV